MRRVQYSTVINRQLCFLWRNGLFPKSHTIVQELDYPVWLPRGVPALFISWEVAQEYHFYISAIFTQCTGLSTWNVQSTREKGGKKRLSPSAAANLILNLLMPLLSTPDLRTWASFMMSRPSHCSSLTWLQRKGLNFSRVFVHFTESYDFLIHVLRKAVLENIC